MNCASKVLVSLATLALPSGHAIAQQSPPPEAPAALPKVFVYGTDEKQGSEANNYRVDAVNFPGPMGNAKLLDTPYTIQVLPAAVLENVQARSVKEALKYFPLIQFQEQQGSEVIRPATRGMQSSNFQNARVDGMHVFITGANAVESFQQIEVLSGAQSAVYGPANPAGMFNFVTKRPTATPLARLTLGYATERIFTAHADLSGHAGESDAFGYRLNLLSSKGEAYVTDSELDRKLTSIAVDVKPWRATTVEFTFTHHRLSQKGYQGWFTYGQAIQLPEAPDPTRVGYGQSYAGVDLKNETGGVRVKQDLGPDWHLVAGVQAQRIDRNINTPVNNLTNNAGAYTSSLGNGFAPRFGINSDILYLNGMFNTGRISHDLTLGTTGYRATTNAVSNPATPASVLLGTASIDDPRTFPPPATFPDVVNQFRSSVSSQQGVNVSDTITFTPQWSARLAVSKDWMHLRNYNKAGVQTSAYADDGYSPMPSVMFKPREDMTIYATYANSLQAGDLAPAGSANANTGLPPYRSKQVEAGFKMALPKVDLSAALFRLERPFANVDPIDNTFKISGDQVNVGLEAMAIGEVARNLTLYGGITILDAKLKGTGKPATDDKYYVGVPKFKSNFLLEYRQPAVPGLVLVFDWQYSTKRPGNDTNTTFASSYSTIDLGARYVTKAMGKTTTYRLALNNATDERYWSSVAPSNITGTNLGNMVAHIGAPRTVVASMSIDF